MAVGADEEALVAFLERSGGEWIAAACSVAEVERLRRHDHHIVTVSGRAGLLLTYHLWSEPVSVAPRVYILFRHVDGHPRAPAEVQRSIERLLY